MRGEGKKLAQVARIQARGQLHIPNPGKPDESEVEFDEALAVFGLQQGADDDTPPPPDKCYLWPCNVPTFNLWQRLQTQWRVGGMGGCTGLDYAGVNACMDLLRIKPKGRSELFSGLQAMEFAALQVWAVKQD